MSFKAECRGERPALKRQERGCRPYLSTMAPQRHLCGTQTGRPRRWLIAIQNDFSSMLSPEVFSTSGYFRKTAGVWNQSFPSPRWAAKGYGATPTRLPAILLASRSQHVVFTYDQVVVTALRVGFSWESHGHATCGIACNCTEPEAWITEASGQFHEKKHWSKH